MNLHTLPTAASYAAVTDLLTAGLIVSNIVGQSKQWIVQLK